MALNGLASDFLNMSKTQPESINDATVAAVISGVNGKGGLVNELKAEYRNGTSTINLSAINADVLQGMDNFAKSDAFNGLPEGSKGQVMGNFKALAVELAWRSDIAYSDGTNSTANRRLLGSFQENEHAQ